MLSVMPCAVCGTVNPVDHNFCSQCGTGLRTTPCPACGGLNAPGQVVCERCGGFLKEKGDQALFDQLDERKFVTALFADIKGSVALLSERDIEEGRRIFDTVILRISSLIRRHEGTVIDTVGDGVFALFGAPRSLDGHPHAAVNAALEIQDSMASQNGSEPLLADIQLRIGIDTGDIIWRALQVGRVMRHLPIGQTVNQASRLQEVAEPGTVLIGESTYALVKDYFNFTPSKDLVLKGIPEPVKAYEVLKPSDVFRNLQISMKRGLSPLVGRERELQTLMVSIQRFACGSGTAMILVSEAGGGKSRLLHEVTKSLQDNFRILEAFCISHLQSSPWYSVVQLTRNLLGLSSGLSSLEAKRKIEAAIESLDPDLLDELPTLFQFLDLDPGLVVPANADPTVRKRKYISLLLRLLILQAKLQPLVVIIEDLHWLDQQSSSLVDAILSITHDHPIFLLCTTRPEGLGSAWRSNQASILQLSNLEFSATRELIESLVPGQAIGDALVGEIHDKTQGNPFFIEEIVRSPQFVNSLLPDKQSFDVDSLVMPSTIKMAISDRIDRLSKKEKNILQILAVAGIRCRIPLLVRLVADDEAGVLKVLSDLEDLGFVVNPNHEDDIHVQFGHVLIQEVAYSSLLRDQRAALHEHIGDTIQFEVSEVTSEILPELAHHYLNSSNDGKAVEHLRLAGESAIQRSAHQEAQNYLKLCLKRLEKSRSLQSKSTCRAQLWLSLGVSLQVTLGYAAEDVRTAYENAVEHSEEAKEAESLLAALRGYGIFNIVKANYPEAARIADRLKQYAQGDAAFALEHLILSGLSYSYRGELEKGAKFYQKGLEITDKPASATTIQYSGYSPGICHSYYALNALFAGHLRLAIHHAYKGLEVALDSGIPVAIAQSRGMLAHVLFCLSEFSQADEQHQINMAYADDNGFAYWSLLARILTCWTKGYFRNEPSSLDELQAYISAYRGSGALIGVPWFLNLHAELLRRFGRARESLVVLGEAEGIASLTQERFFLVDTLRLKGELHAALSSEPVSLVAAQCYREALNLARVQGSWLPGIRAAFPLARLLQRQGDLEAARALIADHYKRISWIPCPDHEEAQSLMKDLSLKI